MAGAASSRYGAPKMRRALAAALGAAATLALGVAGAAQAAPATHAPGAMIRPAVSPAPLAKAGSKPRPCFYVLPDCASSDPAVGFTIVSEGSTTGCTFKTTVAWGDKARETKTYPGGSNGSVLARFTHDYAKPGSFTITVTGETTVGSCGSAAGTLQFTLITAGVYGDFQSQSIVDQAVKAGWSMIANVAGKGKPSGCKAPWTGPTNNDSDSNVEKVLAVQKTPYPAWISYWTPAVPPDGQPFLDAGYAAGQEAAGDIEAAASAVAKPVTPAYVTLDFETSDFNAKTHKETGELSCGHNRAAGQAKPKAGDKLCWDRTSAEVKCFQATAADWENFATGWADGIKSITSPLPLAPAIYVTKSEYNDKKFGVQALARDADLPVIIAVAPILGTTRPPTGPSVIGYAAYGTDAEPAVCGQAADYIKHVKAWGGITSLQFAGSEICAP